MKLLTFFLALTTASCIALDNDHDIYKQRQFVLSTPIRYYRYVEELAGKYVKKLINWTHVWLRNDSSRIYRYSLPNDTKYSGIKIVIDNSYKQENQVMFILGSSIFMLWLLAN